MDLLTTALVSALVSSSVAAITTVVLEWTVRPRIEARTDLALETERLKRQLDPWIVTEALRQVEDEEARSSGPRSIGRLEYPPTVKEFDSLLSFAGRVFKSKKDLDAVRSASMLLLFYYQHGPYEESGDKWEGAFHDALDFLRTSRWRIRKRRRMLSNARLLAGLQRSSKP